MERTFRILLLIEPGVVVDLEDDIAEWKKYEKEKIGFDLQISKQFFSVEDLTHKPFGITDGGGRELYGLDGIKERVRPLVKEGMHDFVVFIYDIKDTETYRNKETRSITDKVRHWCYFSPLYPGMPFAEVITKDGWKPLDAFRVLSHEHRHALCNRIRALGHPILDLMDRTYVLAEKKEVQYYKEHEPWATDGNRALQNILLTPYLSILAARPEVLSFIERLKKILASLMPSTPSKDSPGLIKWAEAIKQHEGWYVGSRSYRNFNPGNFRLTGYIKSLGAMPKGDDKNFAIFPTYAKGWEALLQFLRDARANQLVAYRAYAKKKGRPGSMPTLEDFFNVYAPSFENDSARYAEVVAKSIGVPITTPINLI